MEKEAKEVGAVYLAAPVFGQPPAVAVKTAVLTVAGDPKAVEIVLPILEYLGRAVLRIGPDVQQGQCYSSGYDEMSVMVVDV